MPDSRVIEPLYVEVRRFKLRQSFTSIGSAINIDLGTPNPGSYWFVERVAIRSDTVQTSGLVFSLLVGDDPQKGVDWTSMMETTTCVNQNATDEDPAIFVSQGEQLKAHWTGLIAGETVWINVQISERTLIAAELPAHIDFDRFAVQITS